MLCLQLADHAIDSQLVPERLHDVHGAVGPGIEHGNSWLGGHRFLAGEDTQNAAGKATQGHTIDLLGPAKVVDDLADGAALVGIPKILGQLVVLDGGAVCILAASGAQVHA